MPTVLIEKLTPQITVLTLNRPERRNALTIELLSELNAAIKIASDQPQERVIILRGAGAAFCTGLDLKEAADQRKAHATAEMVANTLIAISQTRLITIAVVHGAAIAGGAGIMSACDFVVAAQGTKNRLSRGATRTGGWTGDDFPAPAGRRTAHARTVVRLRDNRRRSCKGDRPRESCCRKR